MKIFKLLLFFVVLLTIVSNKPVYHYEDELLIGVWVYKAYENDQAKYKKKYSFDSDQTGFEFKKDGKFIKRQNAGPCGTPPITYSNFSGTWKKKKNANIEIRYQDWRGEVKQELEIVELNKSTLVINTISKD